MDDRRAGTRMLPDYRAGALRSRLISRLTGLTPRQLSYWHRSALIPAHAAPGALGRPRLYSWVDYLKLRDKLEKEIRPRGDALSKYLDALEKEYE